MGTIGPYCSPWVYLVKDIHGPGVTGPQDRYHIPLYTLPTEEGGNWFFGPFIQQSISIPFLSQFLKVPVVNSIAFSWIFPLRSSVYTNTRSIFVYMHVKRALLLNTTIPVPSPTQLLPSSGLNSSSAACLRVGCLMYLRALEPEASSTDLGNGWAAWLLRLLQGVLGGRLSVIFQNRLDQNKGLALP